MNKQKSQKKEDRKVQDLKPVANPKGGNTPPRDFQIIKTYDKASPVLSTGK